MTRVGLIADEWLVSYAAGALTDAQAMILACHVDYHKGLQDKVADAEAIGGALLADSAPAAISNSAFDDLMARIDTMPDEEGGEHQLAATSDADLPVRLQDYLGKPLDQMKWRMMGPGMRQCKLAEGENGEKLWLLKAKGGTVMPVHGHRGTEMTLVLRGSYHVGDDHYTPGLIEIAGPEIEDHQPMIDEGEECICLVVTDAPIKLHSLVGRMVQPFIGL